MTWLLEHDGSQNKFRQHVEQKSGQKLALCYQCGKCTAGCPVAYEMDYPPHQVVRGVQLGMRDALLSSRAIWLCAACETCTTRCPQGVDLAGVMDALRQIAHAEHKSAEPDVSLFHRLFLAGVRQHGRVFEVGLMGFYNLLSGHYLKDVIMAPGMFAKGKLGLLPPRAKDIQELKTLFARARELEAKRA